MTKLFLFSVLFPLVSLASPNMGKKVGISTSSEGSLNLGVHYAYDLDYQWAILFGTDVPQKEIATLPKQLAWHVENARTGERYSADQKINSSDLMLGGADLTDHAEVTRVLLNQKNIALVFTMLDGTPLYYVDLGELCRTRPTYFNDITNMGKRCDQIKAADLP